MIIGSEDKQQIENSLSEKSLKINKYSEMSELKIFCRICLRTQDDTNSIYTTKNQRYLPSVIYNISGVKIFRKKEPNAKICNRCANSVIAAETIILKCQESEQYLSHNRLLKEQKRKKRNEMQVLKIASEIEILNSQSTEENEPFIAFTEHMSDFGMLESKATSTAEAEVISSQRTQEIGASLIARNQQSTEESGVTLTAEFELMSGQSAQENEATFAFDHKIKGEKTETNKAIGLEYISEVESSHFEIFNTEKNNKSGKVKKSSIVLKKHECQHCTYRTNSRICLVEHYRYSHNLDESSMYKCGMCTEAFSWRRTLFLHMEKVHKTLPEEKRFICAECGKAYFRRHFLYDHIRQQHRGIENNFKCPQPDCDKTFNRKFTLRRHFISMHTDVKRYYCKECDLYFSCLDKWRYHVQSVHERKHCPTCGLWFRKQKVLDAHIASKKCEKCIYKCPKCPRSFTSLRGVKVHLEQTCKNSQVEEIENVIQDLLEC